MIRRLRVLLVAVSLILGLTPLSYAKTPIPVHFTAVISPSPAHPGEVATVVVKATIDTGWHVYSIVPTPNGPAATEIDSIGDWTAAAATSEDAPTRKFDPNFSKEVGYHEGTATFSRQFRIPQLGSEGQSLPPVTLRYQTCNDKICLPPTSVQIPLAGSIVAGPVRAHYAQAASVPATAAKTPAQKADSGLLLFLVAALGWGLLAIVTPCVLPLVPIALTNFVKQAEGSQAKLVRLSWGYGAGIVALYVAFGAVVAALLQGRANSIAANPWVNLVEFVLFVVFALSFFETIQIRLPGNLVGLQQSARRHGGTAGLLLLGVTFVLGSFTCTAPFVGTLLVSAADGHWTRPLLGMLIFALAFASPFFIFALFPQWISRIPKGGVWLARFKATLGFIELAAALKFLSNADQVWQWKLLTQPVLLAAWAMIFFCAALYLWGTLRFGIVAETEPATSRVPASRGLVAAVFALLGLYCFWGLSGRPISPVIGAFLPPSGYGGVASAGESSVLPWLSNYSTALAQAKAEGKPLLIDFTGYTCTNCRWNEKNIFPRPGVQEKLANYVRVQLYTDGKGDAGNQQLQQDKFGDIALPLYGIVDPNTEAVLDKTEGIQSVGGFTQFLAKSASSSPSEAVAQASPSAMWLPYTPQAVAAAAKSGKPVIVDFTAKWCVNCKEIEHDVFENPEVKPTLQAKFTTLRADLTQWNSPQSVALQKQYGFGALPTIIFLDKTGQEIKPLRITGRLPVAAFQAKMVEASGSPVAVASR